MPDDFDDGSRAGDRAAMVAEQIERRGVRDPQILRAMREVPRHDFVPEPDRGRAYMDRPLAIGEGQTISQPWIVARMLEAAELRSGDRVLEVGAGSGYAAACLGRIAREVFAVERHGPLARRAQATLAQLGLKNVHVRHADGARGLPEEAPFDVILVSAGGEPPPALKRQLAEGGRLVIPLPREDYHVITVIRRRGERFEAEEQPGPVRFVPLLSGVPAEAQAARAAPEDLSEALRDLAEPFEELPELSRMVDRFADRRVICLGECSHGTSEFYRARAAITDRLVCEHGFTLVAVEADWPDAAAYDASIRRAPAPTAAAEPFARFPRWMWRNEETWDLLRALRTINESRPPEHQARFHGLDVYSLCASIDAVLGYLEGEDPEAADIARGLYGCLKPYCDDPGGYIRASQVSDRYAECEDRVARVLAELQARRMQDGEALFDAEQNAQVVIDAERYYRAMYYASASSWNLRDTHMADTLDRLLERHGPEAKAVVWAHNSHIGDARATEMGTSRGELNIGQLIRERHGAAAALIGFSTHSGEVAAADHWGGPMREKTVRPGLPDSLEDHAHRTGVRRFLLDLSRAGDQHRALLSEPRLQRAIGVIYRPATERLSHYFDADLANQFDAWVWFDRTHPVVASHRPPAEGAPDLFPYGV